MLGSAVQLWLRRLRSEPATPPSSVACTTACQSQRRGVWTGVEFIMILRVITMIMGICLPACRPAGLPPVGIHVASTRGGRGAHRGCQRGGDWRRRGDHSAATMARHSNEPRPMASRPGPARRKAKPKATRIGASSVSWATLGDPGPAASGLSLDPRLVTAMQGGSAAQPRPRLGLPRHTTSLAGLRVRHGVRPPRLNVSASRQSGKVKGK